MAGHGVPERSFSKNSFVAINSGNYQSTPTYLEATSGWRRPLSSYADAAMIVVASTTVAYIAQPFAQGSDIAMIQLLGIVILALRHEIRITIVSSLCAVALFDFLFVPPRMTFAWSDVKRIVTFAGMVVVAAVISTLSNRTRRQEWQARDTAVRTMALCKFQAELSSCAQIQQLISITQRHIERLMAAEVAIILATEDGNLDLAASGVTSSQAALAQAAWQRREVSSEATAQQWFLWVPLAGIRETLGVVGVGTRYCIREDSESGLLVVAFCNQLATAIERVRLAVAAQRSQVEVETERMRSSLLSAVSHDLKTPLAAIVAAGTTLLGQEATLGKAESHELLSAVVTEAERLGRLIQKILSVTRLESPTIELRRSPEALEEIIAAARERVGKEFEPVQILVDLPNDLPWVQVEPALVEQVFVNLFENALRHAGPHVSIKISVRAAAPYVTVQVSDDGPGIAEPELEKVFEKFYRGKSADRRDGGAGLGLTICRAIITAHGGRIGIRNGGDGGVVVEFSMPIAEGFTETARATRPRSS